MKKMSAENDFIYSLNYLPILNILVLSEKTFNLHLGVWIIEWNEKKK